MDPSLAISLVSTFIAVISAYIAQYKKGKLVAPKIRAYRMEPLNFHSGEESYRAVRFYLMLTAINTGARTQAITDLRVRVKGVEGKQDLILEWENEFPCLTSRFADGQFANQATLSPYSSINRVYSFTNLFEPAQGKLVSAMEAACKSDEKKTYPAYLEMRDVDDAWQVLRKFAFRHHGVQNMETNFEKINNI